MARGKKREAADYSEIPARKTESEQESNVTSIFKKREIPADRMFELRGKNSGTVLQSGITTKCSKNLLDGMSTKYPDLLEVGESTETVIEGMRFNLIRTA